MNLKLFGLSFKGRRSNNQDAFIYQEVTTDLYLAAVADGMGGTTGGEIASNAVISGLIEFFRDKPLEIIKESELKNLLTEAVNYSRKKFNDKLNNDTSLSGMGTTLTAALIYKDKFVWCNIGDSRLYRMDGTSIELLTKDHSFIQQHIEEHGEISPEIAQQFSNYLTRVIDGGDDECDYYPKSADYWTLGEGDVILICSDGLILDKTSENYQLLHNYVRGTNTLKKATFDLVSHHYHNGSDDNITMILIENGKLKRKKIKFLRHYIYPPDKKGTIILNVVKKISHRYLIAIFIVLFILIVSIIVLLIINPVNPDTQKTDDHALSSDYESIQPDNIQEQDIEGNMPPGLPPESQPANIPNVNDSIQSGDNMITGIKTRWRPFSDIDTTIPLTMKSTIVWNPYPLPEEILHYEMIVWQNNDTIIFKDNISKAVRSLQLEYIIKHHHGNAYQITIDAHLKNGKVISADTITIKINDQI